MGERMVHSRRAVHSRRTKRRLLFIALVVIGGACGYAVGSRPLAPSEREVTVRARKYAYDPAVIRVDRGDTVKLRFVSEDVVHGFYLEGHDIDVKIVPMKNTVSLRHPTDPERVDEVEEVVFTADREGKFRYRCSHTCGFLHPFMLGELIVSPNRLLPTSLGAAVAILLATTMLAWRGESTR